MSWPARFLALFALAGSLAGGERNVSTGQELEPSAEGPARAGGTAAPEGGSRSAAGGQYLDSVPPWIMPMFCTRGQSANEIDGYICGIGTRISKEADFFLASNTAMLEINAGLAKSPTPWGPPGAFMFDAPLELDISKYNMDSGDGWQWAPKHVKTYAGDIGLYRAAIRAEAIKDLSGLKRNLPNAKDFHPIATPAKLETERNKELSSCRLLTYGRKEDAHEGIRQPIRKLTAIRVEKLKCDEKHVCRMMGKDDDALCGFHSDLGAPILCGEGEHEAVQFIVSRMPDGLDGFATISRCERSFQALEVAYYAKEIRADIIEESDCMRRNPTTPIPGAVDISGIADWIETPPGFMDVMPAPQFKGVPLG